MKFLALVLLPLSALVQTGSAQQPAQQATPVRSPEVASDRRVTFRVSAPNASKVTVFCECLKEEPALTKGANGVWSITVGPIAPDIYEYHFTVDGVDNLDQRNPVVKYNSRPNLIESILEVPAATPTFYDVRPVPHGTVSIKYYQSKATGGGAPTRQPRWAGPAHAACLSTRLPVTNARRPGCRSSISCMALTATRRSGLSLDART